MSSTVNELFQTAHQEGVLSGQSLNVLTGAADIGPKIQAALGVPVDDVMASEVVLLTMMVDDSGSIRAMNNEPIVRNGHNLVIAAERGSKARDSILVHTLYLNGGILYPYVLVDQAEVMDDVNYQANGGTPLYDQTVVLLGTVMAKAQEFVGNGVPVRTVTLIITDGHDEHSLRFRAKDVVPIVTDMLRAEDHIVAAMGIDDGVTDFRAVFREMGIRDEWILTPANTEKEIRASFQTFSQSAVRASQSAVSFSQTAIGGFGK